MGDKESYTPKEMEEIGLAIDNYHSHYNSLCSFILGQNTSCKGIEPAKIELDKAVENCKKILPKSLLDKIDLRGSETLIPKSEYPIN